MLAEWMVSLDLAEWRNENLSFFREGEKKSHEYSPERIGKTQKLSP